MPPNANTAICYADGNAYATIVIIIIIINIGVIELKIASIVHPSLFNIFLSITINERHKQSEITVVRQVFRNITFRLNSFRCVCISGVGV